MRYRITVSDRSTGVRSDVAVECEPDDRVGVALDLVAGALPVSGPAAAFGTPVDSSVPVASSVLREGILLEYGRGSSAEPDPYVAARMVGRAIAVVSGPSAGVRVRLHNAPVQVGRSPDQGLVIDDPDVSRAHAALRVCPDGVEITDQGSANGVFVDGRRITGPHTLAQGQVVQLGASRLVIEDGAHTAAVLRRSADGSYLLNRRFPDRRAPFQAPTVALPTPIPEDDPRGLPVLAMLLPLVLAVALAVFLRSPFYLLFGLLSPVMLGGNWWTERRRRRSRDARVLRTYTAKVAEAHARVVQAADDEDADLRRRFPDPVTVTRTALELRRELWSRRPGEPGWLELRVGVADRSASVTVTGEPPTQWEPAVLRRAPVGVDLEAAGVFGLSGPPAVTRERLAWLLTQCAVLHSADELDLVVLGPGVPEGEAGWVRWLPHARTTSGSVLAGWDDAGTETLVRELAGRLDRMSTAPTVHRERPVGRVLVVLLGSGALLRRPQVADLLVRGPALGLRFLCVDHDERLLPDSCRAVLSEHGGRVTLRVDGGAEIVVASDRLAPASAERVARTLAPLRRVGDTPSGGVPDTVRFTDVVTLPRPEELRAHWRLQPERSAVVLGRDGDGLFSVDIARDGPHALIAGTSGAGKSELLQTWVGSLALANPPSSLSVVFMDYKGGSAFKDLAGLPHVVGTVTNLDERMAARALASLEAELTRRQRQLSAAGAGDRADYLRRAALDRSLPPFPRLLVVVDELAELKENLPELVTELVGVARIGRSLGVHLILATQKPAGVVDAQIRANVNLRVCLRTRDEGESLDVIETGEAAQIPVERPGRALVGRGGPVASLVQTARVTTPAADRSVPRRAAPLHWAAPAAPEARVEDEGLRTDLHALVETVARAAADEGLVAPYRPWSEPLPTSLLLDRAEPTSGRLALGVVDRPAQQLQEPLHVAIGSGHVGVVGSGRTGRTSSLRALAAGLASTHSPDELHLHAVDGGRGLAALTTLPHTGVVADDDDPQRLEQLLVRLTGEVRDRRRLLASRWASSVEELDAPPPSIVLLVDDWAGTTEMEGAAPAALQELLGGPALAAGVTVVVAGDERMLRGRLLNRLEHRLCLRLNNPGDATVLGLPARVLPDGLPPGRGLWTADGCEVQVPLLAADQRGPAQVSALTALAVQLHERFGEPAGDRAPLRLDPLPSRIGRATASTLPSLIDGDVLVGVSGDRLSGLRVPLGDATGHVLIAGPPRTGRSTAAAAIAADVAVAGTTVLLVAPRPARPHRSAVDAGAVLTTPDTLDEALDAHAPSVVVVDDADLPTFDDALVARLTGPGGPSLVVAAALDSFGFGNRGLVAAAKKGSGPVVLLCPPNHLSADYVGVRIGRGSEFSGPPGRALFQIGGDLLLGQVPDVAED